MLARQLSIFNEFEDYSFKDLERCNYKYKQRVKNMFFSLSPKKVDLLAIKITQPKNLLMSYATWKEEKGMYEFSKVVEDFWSMGYHPNIILDSGAFTFRQAGLEQVALRGMIEHFIEHDVKQLLYNTDLIDLFGDDECDDENEIEERAIECLQDTYPEITFKHGKYGLIPEITNEVIAEAFLGIASDYIDIAKYFNGKELEQINLISEYLNFVYQNRKYIDHVISIDDMESPENTRENWDIISNIHPGAIPTFHYREDSNFDELEYYLKNGATFIGLGGIVPVKLSGGEGVNQKIVDWVNTILFKYPEAEYHLFGTQDNTLLDKLLPITSVDGTSWIMTAGKRYKKEKTSKLLLACKNILRKEIFDSNAEYEAMKKRMDDYFS